MLKITTLEDIVYIKEEHVKDYVAKLINRPLDDYSEYCLDGSIKKLGYIAYLDDMVTSEDVINLRYDDMSFQDIFFEWVEKIISTDGKIFYNCCVLIDTDRAINIIGDSNKFDIKLLRVLNDLSEDNVKYDW